MRHLARIVACIVLLAFFAGLPASASVMPGEWSPADAVPGVWRLAAHNVILGDLVVGNELTCQLRQSIWYRDAERATVTVKTASCPNQTGAILYSFAFKATIKPLAGSIFGPNIDFPYTLHVDSGIQYGRGWAQSSLALAVIVQCGKWSLLQCIQVNKALSLSLSKVTPGTPEAYGVDTEHILTESLVTVPFVVWLAIIGLPGLVGSWRRDKYPVPRGVGRFIDVERDVAALRRRSMLWGAVIGIRRFLLIFAVVLLIVVIASPDVRTAVSCCVTAILWLVLAPLARKLSNPIYSGTVYDVRGWEFDRRRLVGFGLRALSWILIAPFALVYLASVLLWSIGGSSGALLTIWHERFDAAVADNRATTLDYIRNAAFGLLSYPELTFGILLLVITVGLALSRLGLRFQVRSAAEALKRDSRLPILYLRNFGDDKIRVRASRISRRGLLGRLSPRHTRPFEELVAWRLNRFGPVIAVNDPRIRLAKLARILHGVVGCS